MHFFLVYKGMRLYVGEYSQPGLMMMMLDDHHPTSCVSAFYIYSNFASACLLTSCGGQLVDGRFCVHFS